MITRKTDKIQHPFMLVSLNICFDLSFFLWEIKEVMLISCLHKFTGQVGWLSNINVPLYFSSNRINYRFEDDTKIQFLTKCVLCRSDLGGVFLHCFITSLGRDWSLISSGGELTAASGNFPSGNSLFSLVKPH